MVDELGWPIEVIPDDDSVFMRAHQMHFRSGELQAGVFRKHGVGMSVNWDKYASAEETRQQARKNPNENAVIAMGVFDIRQIKGLTVEHTPEQPNRAHSDVYGLSDEELTEIRVLLLRIADVVIPLG